METTDRLPAGGPCRGPGAKRHATLRPMGCCRRSLRSCATVFVVGLLTAGAAHAEDLATAPLPRPALATCGGNDLFPIEGLLAPRGAERRHTAPAYALRAFLRSRQARIYSPLSSAHPPLHGWRLLLRTSRSADYGHEARSGMLDFEVLMRRRRGRWRSSTFGPCEGAERVVKGAEIPRLYLKSPQPLTPTTQTIELYIETGTCNPDAAANDRAQQRFDHFEATNDATDVRLLAVMRPEVLPSHGFGCEGVGLAFSRTVRLPAPLGNRRLLADNTMPPRPIQRSPF